MDREQAQEEDYRRNNDFGFTGERKYELGFNITLSEPVKYFLGFSLIFMFVAFILWGLKKIKDEDKKPKNKKKNK